MDIILNAIIGSVLGGTLIEDLADMLTGEEVEGISSLQTAITSSVDSVSDVLVPIASVLICIYFVIELMDKITNDNFNTDQFIRLLIKLVFAIVVVDNASVIAENIATFGTTFTRAIAGAGIESSLKLEANFDDLGFIDKIAAFVIMIIPYFASLVIRVGAYFMVFSYVMEIQIRTALAPLGFADLISGGVNSNGFKYLKKLLALAIQGGIMIIVMICATNLISAISIDQLDENAWSIENIIESIGMIFQIIAAQVAMLGLMGSARTIANDVIG